MDLLEKIDNYVIKEVQRVRENIRDVRLEVQDIREEHWLRRELLARRKEKETKETKGTEDDFWLNA